jgi:hypothetical protein
VRSNIEDSAAMMLGWQVFLMLLLVHCAAALDVMYIGIAAGGGALLFIIIIVIIVCCAKKSGSKQKHAQMKPVNSYPQPDDYKGKVDAMVSNYPQPGNRF